MLKMKNVTISPLTKQDIWEICLVHKLCFIETYMDLLDVNSLIKNELLTIEKYWNRKFNNKEITSYKILFNDKIIGFFSFGKSRKESIAAYEIFTFYILQEFQKQGICKNFKKSLKNLHVLSWQGRWHVHHGML